MVWVVLRPLPRVRVALEAEDVEAEGSPQTSSSRSSSKSTNNKPAVLILQVDPKDFSRLEDRSHGKECMTTCPSPRVPTREDEVLPVLCETPLRRTAKLQRMPQPGPATRRRERRPVQRMRASQGPTGVVEVEDVVVVSIHMGVDRHWRVWGTGRSGDEVYEATG